MQEILVLLIALKQLIKQYHWQAKSYQEHILADKLEDGLEDYIDEVAELSVVAEMTDTQLKAKELLAKAAEAESEKGDLVSIGEMLVSLEEKVNSLESKSKSLGINDLCGRLSNSILRKAYLIQLQNK